MQSLLRFDAWSLFLSLEMLHIVDRSVDRCILLIDQSLSDGLAQVLSPVLAQVLTPVLWSCVLEIVENHVRCES